MATLEWHRYEDVWYQEGIEKAVLYLEDGSGIAWSGLVAVNQEASGTVESIYFDGVKINDLVTPGDYKAQIAALTYPREFNEFEGVLEDQTGVEIHDQPRRQFGLSYRTPIFNSDGTQRGYKIHLVWNLTAMPATRPNTTIGADSSPVNFEWTVTAIPEEIENFRPTAHIVLDSTVLDEFLMEDLESIIYGDDVNDARLPSLKGLTTFIRKWDRFIIRDNGDGTWTAIEAVDGDNIVMDTPDTFTITTDNAEYLDLDTYRIWSTDKNDEDIYG